jgi:hypothetical protein
MTPESSSKRHLPPKTIRPIPEVIRLAKGKNVTEAAGLGRNSDE